MQGPVMITGKTFKTLESLRIDISYVYRFHSDIIMLPFFDVNIESDQRAHAFEEIAKGVRFQLPFCLVKLQSSSYPIHRHAADPVLHAGLPGLFVAQARAAELGINEHGVGYLMEFFMVSRCCRMYRSRLARPAASYGLAAERLRACRWEGWPAIAGVWERREPFFRSPPG